MDVVRQALAILLVFGLLGLTIWKLGKGGIRTVKKTRSLEASERVSLTPQHAIHLIRVHGREMVIATHPQGCTVIHSGATTQEIGACGV